jgi:hypothetical protein
MDCPRCGHAAVPEDSCPRCGVVFAKLAAHRRRTSTAGEPARSARGVSTRWVLLAGGGLVALLAVALIRIPRPARPAEAIPASSRTKSARSLPTTPPSLAPEHSPEPTSAGASGISDERAVAQALAHRVNARLPISASDVASAEALFARHPGQRDLQDLLGAVLLAAGAAEAQAHRTDAALDDLRRSAALLPASREPRLALMSVLYERGDWAGLDAAARDLLTLEPDNVDALERLAYALFRQDRNREALDVLQQALEIRESPFATSLLANLRKAAADERGMTQQQISHFHVRYDGEVHEDIGREILAALERHYATLAATLDHRPDAPIPVILFSSQQYRQASGAPAWSAGQFSDFDGRIRIPVGGLTARLGPEMDGTLIHEVTHAFVADRTRGRCPRDLHEGLAQYMEGRRVASELGAEQLRQLADGRMGGVAGFYLQALSFVEYLIGARGQGGMNDLLRDMGEGGGVEDAFRQVYGSDSAALRAAWLSRLRQQHGS